MLGIQAIDGDCVREIYGPAQGYSGRFKDDLTGQVLKDSLVLQHVRKRWSSSTAEVFGRRYPAYELPAHRTSTHQREMGGCQQRR